MVPVHDYEKRYAEAFAITKIPTFKHEPFFIFGGGGGGLFVVLYGIQCDSILATTLCNYNPVYWTLLMFNVHVIS